MADYGTLLLRAASSGLKNTVHTPGPPPLSMMNKAYMAFADWDVQLRVRDEVKPELADRVKVREIFQDGVIYQDENVKVTAFACRTVRPRRRTGIASTRRTNQSCSPGIPRRATT